jgi:hypothetical protein
MGIKKSLGFKIIFICFIITYSCGPDYNEQFVDYVIINESGIEITINSKPSTGEQFASELRLPLRIENNSSFSEVLEISSRNASTSFQTFFGTNNIEVIFGDERKSLFSCAPSDENNNCGNQRNILKFIPDSSNRNEYTFTPNDFDSADICDNSCN